MPIRFQCKCGKKYKVPDRFAGKTIVCPACRIRLVVPETPAESPSEARPQAVPPAPQPPPTGADELELMAEPPPPPVEPQDDFGTTGQPTTPDASDMELMAEPPPPSVDAQADFGLSPKPEEPQQPEDAEEAYAVETEAAPEGETEKCAKCGAALAPDTVMCIECGTRVVAKMPEGVAKQEKKTPPVGALIGGGAGLLLVIGLFVGLIMMASGGREPSSSQPAPPVVRRTPPPRPTPSPPPDIPPEVPPEETRPPEPAPVEIAWQGFDDPALALRDRLREVGATLRAYERENNTTAPSLDAAGVSVEKAGGIVFVPPQNTAAMELRPIAYQEEPNPDGTVFALFHDETVREVAADDLSAVLPQESDGAMLPGANVAFVRKLEPALRVVNHRFAEVEAIVDGETVGRVKMGETGTYSLSPGTHEVTFRAKDQVTEPLPNDFKRGLTYEYALPRFQDMPVLDVRTYRRTFEGRGTEYTLDVSDPETAVMKTDLETIRLPRVPGQASIARDYRSIRGVVEREDYEILGIGKDPIYVSALGGVEEGEVRYKHGKKAVFRRTTLDAVRVSKHVNLSPASAAIVPEEVLAEFQSEFGKRGREYRGADPRRRPKSRRYPAREPRGKQEVPEAGPPKLATPARRQSPKPDFSAFGDSFAETFSDAVQVLLKEAALVELNAAPTEPLGPPDRRYDPRMRPGFDPGARTNQERTPTRSQPKAEDIQELPAPKLFAMLAVYGSRRAQQAVDDLAGPIALQELGHSELLLAQARCSGRNAIIPLNAAATENPLGSAFGLAMIEDPGARSALGTILKSWTPHLLDLAADAFPDVAGPGGRRRFVETWFEQAGTNAISVAHLNALLKIDPYTVEREIAARLLRDHQNPGASGENLDGWRVLARYRHTEAVQALVAMLGTPNAATHQAALLALGETRHPTILPTLREALKGPDKVVAGAACAALVAYGAEEAVALLAEEMPEDLCPASVVLGAPGLAERVGPDRVAELLAGMLHKAKDGTGAGLQAESPPGPPPGSRRAPPTAREGPPAAEAFAQSASAEFLLDALTELNRPTPAVLGDVDEARKHTAPSVRAAAYKTAIALRTPDPAAASAIAAEGLNDADVSVRTAVAATLRNLASETNVASQLEKAAGDSDTSVHCLALEIIAATKVASPGILDAVTTGLRDKDASVILAAATAAEALKDPSLGAVVVEVLAGLQTNPPETPAEPGSREAAEDAYRPARIALIRAAGALRNRDATQLLALILGSPQAQTGRRGEDEDDALRIAAALALGAISDPSAVEGLTRALQPAARSENDELATAVLAALTQYDTPEALQAWGPRLRASSQGGSDDGAEPQPVLLKKLISSCGTPGIYRAWILQETTVLSEESLRALANMAQDAPPEWWPGLVLIAKRCLETRKSDAGQKDTEKDAMAAAAEILAKAPDGPEIQEALFDAFEEAPSLLSKPLAETFRKTRDPEMLPVLKDRYSAIGRMYQPPAASGPGGRERSGPAAADDDRLSETDRNRLVAAIAEALGHIGGKDAARELGRMSYAEESPQVLAAVIEALARTQSGEAVRYLGRLARGHTETARVAARALIGAADVNVEEARKTFERLTKGFDPYLAAIGADGLYALDAKGLLKPEETPAL